MAAAHQPGGPQARDRVQGVLSDDLGNLVADGAYDLTFRIYDVPVGGVALWTEVDPGVAVVKGGFSVVLGLTTPINLAFDQTYYLGVQVFADAELTPRVRLASSPYALGLRLVVVRDPEIFHAEPLPYAVLVSRDLPAHQPPQGELCGRVGCGHLDRGGVRKCDRPLAGRSRREMLDQRQVDLVRPQTAVWINLRARREGRRAAGEPLYLKRHRIRTGQQTIRMTVPREPARAGIDPYHKLIEREANDNLVRVEPAVAAAAAGAGR